MSDEKKNTAESIHEADLNFDKEKEDLNSIRDRILYRIKKYDVFDIYFGYSSIQDRYGITVFYHTEEQMRKAEVDRLSERISEITTEEIVRADRGSPEMINLAMRTSSDEEVQRNYGGNYYLAMR